MSHTRCLAGCGILKKEILYLNKKNGWQLETCFACSSLHVNFDKLSDALNRMLDRAPEDTIVLYGECHPLMDRIVASHHAHRVPAQNCIEMLLGKDVFTSELQKGAFFLLEDWARRWDFVTKDVFGRSPDDMIDILRSAHDHFLCLRTPCSGDFREDALTLSKRFKIPLEWRDVSLDILDTMLCNLLSGVETV
ncbi:MAG: DUF1638 domain-containing protein [Deltaproteobacteria bacterium]|nr:DUF1638 domain-containing protein [Deltaproteobacteria bacterium]